jgi:hypothetical protein
MKTSAPIRSTRQGRGPFSYLPAIAAATVMISAFASALADEIHACNSDLVKKVILDGSINKLKDAAIEYHAKRGDPPSSNIQQSLQRWSASIVNIRQIDFDGKNNTRYCAGDFEYQNLPIQEALSPMVYIVPLMFGRDPTCLKSFEYKIEPLLDKPGHIYVSWQCLR